MRAAVYDEYGDPGVLQVREVDDPPVGPDTVLVRARASSVNPVDTKVRQRYMEKAFPNRFPIIPGWDVAGVVERVGPAVRNGLRVGDEVMGYVRRDDIGFGTAAELVPAPERTVTRKPASLSFEEAAALPLAGLTAYQGLVEALDVGAGDTVLVHAASGGVGHFAVQIAKALGARVIGTASARNHDTIHQLGADRMLDYHDGPVSEQLDEQVDAVLDLAGGDVLDDIAKQVTGGERWASVLEAPRVLELGGRYVFARPDVDNLAALRSLVDEGSLRVVISDRFPLDQIAEAHRTVEQGSGPGKVVVTV